MALMLATLKRARESLVVSREIYIPAFRSFFRLCYTVLFKSEMKRSVSRASKISIDAQDSLENSFPGIPDAKWHEYLDKEETDLFILGLREEIFHKSMEICFENYLEKQSVAFTVHCAYLAWCKVLNMYYMFRDPGDLEDPKVKESWEPDAEPEPSVIDSWGSECIKPMDPLVKAPKPEKEVEKEAFEASPTIFEESLETSSFLSDMFDMGEGGEYFYAQGPYSSTSISSVSRKKSIFTRTLSMSRESLPLLEPLLLFQGDGKRSVMPTPRDEQ